MTTEQVDHSWKTDPGQFSNAPKIRDWIAESLSTQCRPSTVRTGMDFQAPEIGHIQDRTALLDKPMVLEVV